MRSSAEGALYQACLRFWLEAVYVSRMNKYKIEQSRHKMSLVKGALKIRSGEDKYADTGFATRVLEKWRAYVVTRRTTSELARMRMQHSDFVKKVISAWTGTDARTLLEH